MAKKQTGRRSKGGDNRKSRGAIMAKGKSRGATNRSAAVIHGDPAYRVDPEELAAEIIARIQGPLLADVTRMALRLCDAGDQLKVVTADAGFIIQRYLIDSIKAGEAVPGTLQETVELIAGPEAEQLQTAQAQVRTLLELLRPFADVYAVAAPKRSDQCRRVRIVDYYNGKQLTGLDFGCFEIAAAALSKGIPTHVQPSGTIQSVADRIANRIHDVGCWSPDFLAQLVESELSKELQEGLGKVQEITARASELGAETERQQQDAASAIATLEEENARLKAKLEESEPLRRHLRHQLHAMRSVVINETVGRSVAMARSKLTILAKPDAAELSEIATAVIPEAYQAAGLDHREYCDAEPGDKEASKKYVATEKRVKAYERALQPFGKAWEEHTSGRNHHANTAGDYFRIAAQTLETYGDGLDQDTAVRSDAPAENDTSGLLIAYRNAAEEAKALGYTDPRDSLFGWFINQAKKANVLNSKLVEIYRNVFGQIAREAMAEGRRCGGLNRANGTTDDEMATKIIEATLTNWSLSGPIEFDGAMIEREVRELKQERADLLEMVMRYGFAPAHGVPMGTWICDELRTLTAFRKEPATNIGELVTAAIAAGFDPNGTKQAAVDYATKRVEQCRGFTKAFTDAGLSPSAPVRTLADLMKAANAGHVNFAKLQAATAITREIEATARQVLDLLKGQFLGDDAGQALRQLNAVIVKIDRRNVDAPPFNVGERITHIPESVDGRVSDCFKDTRWAPELGHWYVRIITDSVPTPDNPNGTKRNLQYRADECRLKV